MADILRITNGDSNGIFRQFHVQGDQTVSVHLMITIQKVTSNVQTVPRQSPDTTLTLTQSVIHNPNYVIRVSD
jgi:hypothetical protein